MRYAMYIPNFGEHSDPRMLGELAHEAEDVGWDGFFLWDHIHQPGPTPLSDPWVALAVIATRTERLTIGPLVTPLARRRPWQLAREAVTLDHLSGGRLVQGVGIGSDGWREYSAFGEDTDYKLHADMLDEGLDVLTGLWSGEPVTYSGMHYHLDAARCLPTPVQQPRIPIWVAGVWPNKRPFRRAAQWDGVAPIGMRPDGLSPDEIRDMCAYIALHRQSATPIEVAYGNNQYHHDLAQAGEVTAAYASVGVTWWLEWCQPGTPLEETRRRIRRGPPTT